MRTATVSCPSTYHAFDVVGIASSLGSVQPLRELLNALPPDFPAAILLVQHMTERPSVFAELLGRYTGRSIGWAQEHDRIQAGRCLVAPPGRHMLVQKNGTLALSDSAKINFVRPSADLLFESLAMTYRERAIGVVLTGRGKDGAIGVRAIKNGGGRVLVQDRATSASFEMPLAAIHTGAVDFVLPPAEIAAALITLVTVRGADAILMSRSVWYCERLVRAVWGGRGTDLD